MHPHRVPGSPPAQTVSIDVDNVTIQADLDVPARALGLVIFCHGSGSSRHSVRNREVAAALQARQLGTLLLDLLTIDEERRDAATGRWRFDVALLARRVESAVNWALADRRTAGLPLGIYGASTGAAAALVAAAHLGTTIAAVVSRGGRPDLAGPALSAVSAPTLLIVGGRDLQVLALNRQAAEYLPVAELAIVPGATHLFEEPGAMEQVSALARDWLLRCYLTRSARAASPEIGTLDR
ncbi:MAG: dienelactone hydrolase family protein [Anaerolineae bacterium]